MKRLLFILIAITLVLTGCIGNNNRTIYVEDVDIYFALKGNEGLSKEIREIQYTDQIEKYRKTAEEYLKGPKDKEKFEVSVDKSSEIRDIKLQDKNLFINLSSSFNQFSGSMHEAAVVASLVNTMVQFEEIDSVKILVDGKELIAPSGEPYGYLKYIDFSPNSEQREVTLYFGNSQATHVIGEQRKISINPIMPVEDFYKKVIEELILGPFEKNLYRTIPKETKVTSVSVEGSLLRVDFSKEMHTKHWHGAAGEEMTVLSLVNTLTEFEGIDAVLPTVEGQPLSIEHMYVTEPLTRNTDKILR